MARYEFLFIQAPLNDVCRNTSVDAGPALIYLY